MVEVVQVVSEPAPPNDLIDRELDPIAWAERERHWRRKLGRLKLGVEPLEEQLARYRRATGMLSVVTALNALMFVALFAAFGAPKVGLIVSAIILLPIAAFAWLDFKMLERRAAAYERERRAFEGKKVSD
jgi:hypothetical protein